MFYEILSSIAKSNKYTKTYISICQRAQIRASTRKLAKEKLGIVEAHHILPKSFGLGGIKDSANIAYLTTYEHFIVHHLATKMFSGNYHFKMIEAFSQFKQGRAEKLSSKQISIIMKTKSFPASPERKKNISIARKNTEKINCIYCNKFFDPGNYKQFHGENCKLNPNIDLSILEKRSFNKQNSVLKAIQNGNHHCGDNFKTLNPSKLKFNCIHCCREIIGKGAFSRFHGDNCKSKTF